MTDAHFDIHFERLCHDSGNQQWPFTVEAQVQFQVILCGILVDKLAPGQVSLRALGFVSNHCNASLNKHTM